MGFTTSALCLGSTDYQRSFKRVLPRLMALDERELASPTTDMRRAALIALAVAERLAHPAARAPFEGLSGMGQFTIESLDALADIARAAWFVRYQVIVHASQASRALIAPELAARASALRKTMLKVANYYLADDEAFAPQLAAARSPGPGYQGLADALLTLASIYDAATDTFAGDARSYQPSDAALARRLASEVLTSLGASVLKPRSPWQDVQARAWTLLRRTYGVVQRTGRFVTPGAEGVRAYPPINQGGRPKKQRHAAGRRGPSVPLRLRAGTSTADGTAGRLARLSRAVGRRAKVDSGEPRAPGWRFDDPGDRRRITRAFRGAPGAS